MKTVLTPTAAILTLSLAQFAHADSVTIPTGVDRWEEVKFDGLAPNSWRVEDGALVVGSNASVSVLYHRVSVDLRRTPVLRWRWRVDTAPPATDLFDKSGDDRALSLGVGFAYDSANASMGERMKRMVVETVAGSEAPGRVMSFVWGGTAPAGTIARTARTGESGRLLVMRGPTAATGGWVEEEVDLAHLYRSQWGSEPTEVISVDFFADTDHTASRADGRIADIRFEAR